jgi:hypothetical protein
VSTLAEFAASWKDEPWFHSNTRESFCQLVNADSQLFDHRLHIEQGGLGFGDRSFHWMWKMIVDCMPEKFSFLEIGIHCGQILSLVGMLAARTDKDLRLVGISPLNGDGLNPPYIRTGGDHRDYKGYIYDLCDRFHLKTPILIEGYSDEKCVVIEADDLSPYNILYIDGSHLKPDVLHDLRTYTPMLKPGGLLVCDDSANRLKLTQGLFAGFQSASDAVDELLPPFGTGLPGGWTHLGNVVHNRIWRKGE